MKSDKLSNILRESICLYTFYITVGDLMPLRKYAYVDMLKYHQTRHYVPNMSYGIVREDRFNLKIIFCGIMHKQGFIFDWLY